jgi:hypothetical protein
VEAAGLLICPAKEKPTQEYRKCTNLQILSTSFFTLKFERPDKFAFGINIRVFIIKKGKNEDFE